MARNVNFSEVGNVHFAKHPDDEPLQSSINEIHSLTETTVWQDIETLIENRLDILKDSLIKAEKIENIRRIQGEIHAWRHFRDMPQTLINYIEIQNNNPS